MILGIDEVGRGAWAGPLVVGAVVLSEGAIDGLTDSKALSKKRREKFDATIRASGAGIGLGWVAADEVDTIGLSEALRLATKRAVIEVQASGVPFHEIVIDGTVNFLQGTSLQSYVSVLKKADLLISSVSAASIVAKVARDAYMIEQSLEYPEYGFEQHVGYGTVSHRRAIESHGVTPLHRLSFAPLHQYAKRVPSKSGVTSHSDQVMHTTRTTRAIGDSSETAAAEYLQRRGYEILDRNWKTKICEIDIVAQREGVYYFIEVKHRNTDTSGDGIAAITSKKLHQMKKAAELYVLLHKLASVDLRLVAISTKGGMPQVEDVTEITRL